VYLGSRFQHTRKVWGARSAAKSIAQRISKLRIEANHAAFGAVYTCEVNAYSSAKKVPARTTMEKARPPHHEGRHMMVTTSSFTSRTPMEKAKPPHHEGKHILVKTSSIKSAKHKTRKKIKRRAKMRMARINKSRKRIDEINQNGDLGPLVKFIKTNTERIKIITEGIFDIPFDFAYHFLGSLHALVIIGAIGFIWILVWMLTESFAIEFKGKVGEAFDLINGAILLIDILIDTYVLMVLGPMIEFVAIVACDLNLGGITIKQYMPGTIRDVFCNDMPGFGNPLPIGLLLPKSRFIAEFWTHLETMQSDCADFSTGIEEFQATFKLLLSPYVCPVLQHVRPVSWLHDFFYYTIGWASWAEGTKGSYENELAKAITHHDRTQGLKGNPSCTPPPDVLWCYIFGLGFLIIEIILPLFVVMLIFTPLKKIVRAILGIAFSALYYSFDFVTNMIEKGLGSINWAGTKRAWLVVLSLCTLVTTLVFWDLMGVPGIAFGALAGVAVSVYTIETRGGHFFEGPSTTEVYIASAVVAAAIAIPCLAVTVFQGESVEMVKQDYYH
tara:strand:+ start:2643 stop:4310 length:1668 start_codon:yes stop_codon:yes gene_type:complete